MNRLLDPYGQGYNPLMSDAEDVTTAHVVNQLMRNQQYEQSPFGRINALLQASTDQLEGTSGFNPVNMLLEGAKTANRWVGSAAGYGDRLQPQDMLAPLGLAAVTAPFSRIPATLASKNAMIYDPPRKEARAFSADYGSSVPADATGRLKHDIEGRPLTAEHVVGRRMVGGDDEAFPAEKLNALTTRWTGESAQAVSPREIGQAVGRVVVDRRSGRPQGVELRNDLSASTALKVLAHENAHIVDEIAGQIPTTGLQSELRTVYHDLNDPTWRRGKPTRPGLQTRPEQFGYRPGEVPREYIAEAVRAYMADPNYIKTVAPKTAAAIRKHVNAHPELSRIIQFNADPALASVPGLVVGGMDRE